MNLKNGMATMIRKFIRACVIFLVAVTITLWFGMQTDKMQIWAKQTIAKSVASTLGYNVTLKKIGGLLPFYITLEHISLENESNEKISVDSITIVPNWFGFLLGNHSFFYIGLDSVDLRAYKNVRKSEGAVKQISGADLHLSRPIHIWDYRIQKLFLPNEYNAFLLNDLHDDLQVGVFYIMSGQVHYKPEKQVFSHSMSISPIAQDVTFATCNATVKVSKDKTNVTLSLDAIRAPTGSIFKELPCDELHVATKLQAKTPQLIQALSSDTKPKASLFNGTWDLSAIKKKEATPVSPYYQLNVSGTVAIPALDSMKFSTMKMRCQEIHTIRSQVVDDQSLEIAVASDIQNSRSIKETYFSDIPITGKVTGSCQVQDTKNIVFSLESQKLTVLDKTMQPLKLAASVTSEAGIWQGKLQFDLQLQKQKQQPLVFSGSADFKSDVKTFISFSNGSLLLAKHPLAFDVKCLFFPLQIDGKIESRSSDMSGLAQAFGLQGKAQGRASLFFEPINTPTLSQDIVASIELDQIHTKELILERGLLSLKSHGLLDQPLVLAELTLQNMQMSGNTYERAHLLSSLNFNDGAASTAHVNVSGYTHTHPFSFESTAEFTMQNGFSCSIDTCKAQVSDFMLENEKPIRVEADSKGFKVLDFSLIHNGKEVLQAGFEAAFETGFEKTKKTVNGRIIVEDFPLPFLDPIAFGPLYGTISGQLELYGQCKQPQFHLSAASSDFSLLPPNTLDLLPQMVSLQMQYLNNMLIIDTEIQNFRIKEPIVGHLQIPMHITCEPYSMTILPDDQLKGSLKGQFAIQTLFQGSNTHVRSLKGDVIIDAALFGTYATPRLFGSLAINRAQVQLPQLGLMLQDLDTTVKLDKTQAIIETFSCSDSLDGKASGSASAEINSLDNISYTLTSTLSNFQLINKQDARVASSGTLSLSGTKKEAHLKGDLQVDQAQILISAPTESQMPKLDITYINVKKTQKVPSPQGFFLYYDISIDVDKNAHIMGLGLESEWKGKIRIAGQNAHVILSGNIDARSGSLNFGNKLFDLTKGSVEFKGDLVHSELAVIASYETQSIIAQIILKGTLDSPKIYLQSNPIMAEKEILSWIIFNKSSSEITPVQGLQLAQVLLKLKKGNNDPDIIDTIKGQFGIDRIDFGAPATVGPTQNGQTQIRQVATPMVAPMANTNDDAAFQVGKYISDGVLVTLSNDVTNEVNRIGIEANLTKHIVAQVYVGDDAETQISLQWKNRY